MARNKHAAALFEVMQDNKKRASARSQPSTRTPNWWFKTRDEPAIVQHADPNDPTTGPIKSPLIAPRIAAVEATPLASPATAQQIQAPPQPQAQPQSRPAAGRAKRDLIDPTRPVPTPRPRPEADRSGAMQFDRDRRELALRIKLPHAIISVFAIMMVVAMAYVLGRHETMPGMELATTETATAVEAPHKLPAQPKALDVVRPRNRPAANGGGSVVVPHPPGNLMRSGDHDISNNPPLANAPQGMHVGQHVAATDGPRTIGVNYLMAQSYPEEQAANEARDFLVKNGIACTVEKGIWPNNWYSVMSSRGFERIHTPECEGFQRQVVKLGDKFAGSGKWKHFEPMLYSWK